MRKSSEDPSHLCAHCQQDVSVAGHRCPVLSMQGRLRAHLSGARGDEGAGSYVNKASSQAYPASRPQGRIVSSFQAGAGVTTNFGGGTGGVGNPQRLSQSGRSPSTDSSTTSSSYFSARAGDFSTSTLSPGDVGGDTGVVSLGEAWVNGRETGMTARAVGSEANQRWPIPSGVSRDPSGHVEGSCPVCGHYFTRLRAHLSRGKSCGKSEQGRALLLLMRMRSPTTRDVEALTLSTRPAATAAVAGGASGAVARESSVGTGSAAAAREDRVGSNPMEGKGEAAAMTSSPTRAAKSAKETEWPCPICTKPYQRIGTHLHMSEQCRAVSKSPPGSTVKCRCCGEVIGVTLELLKQHAFRCSGEGGKKSTAGVAAPLESLSSRLTTPGSTAAGFPATTSAAIAPFPPHPLAVPGLVDPPLHHELERSTSSTSSTAGGSAFPRGSNSNGTSLRRAPKAAAGKSSTDCTSCKRRAWPPQIGGGGGSGGGGGGRASPSPSGGSSRGSGGGGGGTAPARLKRRASASSAASYSSANSPRFNHLDRRPSLADAVSGGSFTAGNSLGLSDSDSDQGSDDGADSAAFSGGGRRSGWFGGSLGGGIFGAMRRPAPPKKRWEMAFEAWAREGGKKLRDVTADGRGGVEEKLPVEVEESYPTLVKRAEESALMTVREVRRAAEFPSCEMRDGGGKQWRRQAVVSCNLLITNDDNEKRKGGRQLVKATAPDLGLELAEENKASGPESNVMGGFPVVANVTAGSSADSVGVGAGARLLQVEGLSMHGKSGEDAMQAISEASKRSTSTGSRTSSSEMISSARLVIVSTPWSVLSPTQPPVGNGIVAAAAAAATAAGTARAVGAAAATDNPEGVIGGMACLPRKANKGLEFVELCWSVLMVAGGGVPPPTDQDVPELAAGERPAGQDAEVARRLGFDVERREVSRGMKCIEVSSVAAGGLAARHGLQTKDLVLAVDGNHLLGTTQSSFWLEVGRTLRACDSVYRRGEGQSGADAAAATAATVENCDGFEDSCWLRFLVFRRGSVPAAAAATSSNGTTAASLETAGTRPVVDLSGTGAAAAAAVAVAKKGPGRGRGAAVGAGGLGVEGAGPTEREMRWRMPPQQARVPPHTGAMVSKGAATDTGTRSTPAPSFATAPASASGTAPAPEAAAFPGDHRKQGGKGKGAGGGQQHQHQRPRFDRDDKDQRDEKRRRLEARRRPAWWQPQQKGSHRAVLSLRPADGLPGWATPGEPVPPGAFLLVDLVLGDKLTIPAGAKLSSVDGTPTGCLEFEAARDVALTAGPTSVLEFE